MRRGDLIVSLRLSTGSVGPAAAVELRRGQRSAEIVALPDDWNDDARLSVDPNTDSVDDGFGEGNVGTGESGARMASTEAAVNRDDDTGVVQGLARFAVPPPPSTAVDSRSGAGFATRSW